MCSAPPSYINFPQGQVKLESWKKYLLLFTCFFLITKFEQCAQLGTGCAGYPHSSLLEHYVNSAHYDTQKYSHPRPTHQSEITL